MWVLAKCAMLVVGALIIVQLVASAFETVALTRQAMRAVTAQVPTAAPRSKHLGPDHVLTF